MKTVKEIPSVVTVGNHTYEHEFCSKTMTAAKRMKTRTINWGKRRKIEVSAIIRAYHIPGLDRDYYCVFARCESWQK